MGALIRDNVIASLPDDQNIHISSFWYALGNMLPDISWLPVTHPHFAMRSAPYIRKKLCLSLNKHRRHNLDQWIVSPIFSLRLGIVSHYLCDFFCVAHQGSGINGAKRHLNYEHAMRDFFYENRAEVEALCRFQPEDIDSVHVPATVDSLHQVFEQRHSEYYQNQSSFIRDFEAFQVSSAAKSAAFVTDIRSAVACCTCLICAIAVPGTVLIDRRRTFSTCRLMICRLVLNRQFPARRAAVLFFAKSKIFTEKVINRSHDGRVEKGYPCFRNAEQFNPNPCQKK